MEAHYDPIRVLVSLLISILSAWGALEISARMVLHTERMRRTLWLSFGAVAMGIGIWSMHYVGMLAYRTSMPVLYDWPTVLLSMLAAVFVSASALYIVGRKTLSAFTTILGGAVMGAGIASMHYIGMAAMRKPMGMEYHWNLVALSVAAAVLISMAALRITFGSRDIKAMFHRRKMASAILMGLAIPVMHYIGMAAAHFTNGPGNFGPEDLRHAIRISELGATAIIMVTGLLLVLVLVSAVIDRNMLRYETTLRGSERRNDLLVSHNRRLQTAFRAGGVGIWECDPVTGLFYMDAHMREMYRLPRGTDPVSREEIMACIHPDDRERLNAEWAKIYESGDKYENEHRVVLDDGESRHYRMIASIMRNDDNVVQRILGMTWDTTADHHREREIADDAERFRMTLEAIGDAVISVDRERVILYLNPAASALTGWNAAEAIGRPLEQVFVTRDERTNQPRRNPVLRAVESGGRLLVEDGVLISRSGTRHNIKKHVALMDDGYSAVLTFQDITASRQMERKLHYAATHDALTGLLNRAALEKNLHSLWEENRYSGRVHCLCIVDLDRFKIINDTSGHMAGDSLLREIGKVLESSVRPTDFVARMGGDEFMILLVDTTVEQGQAFAARALKEISDLRFPWQDKIYDLTASLGMVGVDCFSATPEMLISQADVATFTSKRNGRNQVSVYVEDGSAAGTHQEMEVVADLRRAIEEDCFELYAQPIVRADSLEPEYFEILLRMRGHDSTLVSPALFIPAAERYGLMTMVDRWVIQNALAQAGPVCRQKKCHRFAINLSADSLSDPELWPFVEQQFFLTGVPPANITFEVTETGFIQNLAHAKTFMRCAQAAGSSIALDDFGTGLSSLSYLKQFPLNVLKVDGSFVSQLTANPLDQSIVRAIAEVAHSMRAVTVAECVEDGATIQLLKTLGVDLIQGWATGRPRPLAEVLQEIEAKHKAEALLERPVPLIPAPVREGAQATIG